MNKHQIEHRLGVAGPCQNAGLVLLAMLASALSLISGGCTAGRGDGATPGDVVEISSNSFQIAWRAPLTLAGSNRVKFLEINDDKVFACPTDNQCYWIDRQSGHVTIITPVAGRNDKLYRPATLSDRVVFPSGGQLRVFDRQGKFLHAIALPYNASSGAVGAERTVYLGLDNPSGGRVVAIDVYPQPYPIPPVWQLMTNGQVSATPALSQGTVFIGGRDGGVYALRAETHDTAWPGLDEGYFPTQGAILADMKVDKDGVYAASMDSKLYCLDPTTGRLRWTYYAGRALHEASSPVLVGNTVYIYVPGSGVVAIDKTGKQEIRKAKWTVAEGRQFLASDEHYAYLSAADGAIIGVDKQSGEVTMRSKRNDYVLFATNLSEKDNTIYAATDDGTVLAIKPVLKPGTVGELAAGDRPAAAVAMARTAGVR